MTEETEDMRRWRTEELPKILTGECWSDRSTKLKVDAAFHSYTGLDGLRGAFYLGVESYNCNGMIANEYPLDDPQRKAFVAGFKFGRTMWG